MWGACNLDGRRQEALIHPALDRNLAWTMLATAPTRQGRSVQHGQERCLNNIAGRHGDARLRLPSLVFLGDQAGSNR